MTIEEAYNNFTQQLKSISEVREANNIADWVFESAGLKRLDRITNKLNQINESTHKQLNEKLRQLLQHKPVQYVLNEAWFYKMKFFVNEHVLIPRPETEELVEWVVEEIRNKKLEIRNKEVLFSILDIGSGSGCIPVALKKELPDAAITSIDISYEALEVAKQNATTQNVKIEFIQLDFLDVKSIKPLPLFNIIVSNPPYIPENEKSKLDKNVVDHEPHLALFVGDNDPFIFYKTIAAFAKTHLKKEGEIFVEVHENYAEEVKKIFEGKNFKTETRKDIYGRERMIKACK